MPNIMFMESSFNISARADIILIEFSGIEYISKRHKKSLRSKRGFVNWLGLEPRTPSLKVMCS
ncbi:MAG TPA: hypothetical protein VN726_03755, partial [Hanamia sp.]|nr:hypothetical protein [Hanamia sp.]